MRLRIAQGLALVLMVVSSGAAQRPSGSATAETRKATLQVVSAPSTAAAAKPKAYQVGTASWYGDYFEGKATASGEPYNMFDMTAAHPTLPLGSYVKVTNLRNRKVAIVRINDRGPIVPGRIIDLSYEAAQALEFRKKGLQRVRLDVVKPHAAQAEAVAELHAPVAY
jgi:rare lipoprotein A